MLRRVIGGGLERLVEVMCMYILSEPFACSIRRACVGIPIFDTQTETGRSSSFPSL